MLQLTYVPHVPHHIKSVQNLQLTHNTAAMRSITMAFFIIMCLGLTWVYLQKVLLKNTRNAMLPIKNNIKNTRNTILLIKNTTTERSVSTPYISGTRTIGMKIPKGMEDAKEPSTFYPLEPDKPGHFVIISGPPCSGKSTVALLMAQKYDFKYYEGDSFFYTMQNPYLPLNSTNLNIVPKQSHLKLSKMDETAMKEGLGCDLFKNWDGHMFTKCVERRGKSYQVLAKHILQERQRLGGNFVVAIGIETRYFRDIIRKIVGPEMVYVMLNISKELQYKRVFKRERNPKLPRFKHMVRVLRFFEGVQEAEYRSISINVDENKTIEIIVEEILSEI